MLFDLSSGRRKRVVQVVYATLALLMGGSLVLFGIGSDAPGGILDAVGLGSDDSGSDNPQYEQQIENAEERLATDPKDQAALLALARYQGLNAQSGISRDPSTGQTEITDDARSELEDAVAAWERYLDLKPRNPDSSVAATMAQSYVFLEDPDGAARAQEVVAEEQKTSAAYGQLAFYYYADLQFEAGDAAAKKAVAAAGPSDRKQVEKSLAQIADQARQQKKLAEQAAAEGGKEAGEAQLTDPFGALGGGAAPAP